MVVKAGESTKRKKEREPEKEEKKKTEKRKRRSDGGLFMRLVVLDMAAV